jgi:fibronectin-binding autotransporter adhesin
MNQAFNRIGNRVGITLAIAVISLVGSLHALATNLFWSADGTTQGGVGTWNTTTANRWGTAAGGPYNLTWNNANVDSAEFGGTTAGAVTVGSNITVNSLTFDTGGYTLAAGSTITFSGANPTITTNVTGTGNSTLSALYTGTGPITKMGTGRLELNNSSNTLSGGYIINQGFINLAAANRLGTGAANPGTLDADWFKFGGGGLTSSNAAAQDLGATRGVTLAGNAWFGASAGNNPVTISAPITGAGSLNLSGSSTSGSPLNSTFNSGMNLTLTNTGNNWTGGINVTLGTLTVGAAGVIPDGAAISLTGGSGIGSTLAIGTFNETVGTVLVNGSLAAITGTSPAVLTGTSYDLRSSGTISAILGGAGVVATKTTANVVTLTGANTFTGGFNLNAGIVRAGNNAALGAANSAVSIANGTTLATSSSTARTLTYAYTINGNFTLGDATGTGAVTMAGTANLGSAARTITVANASDTISGVISGSGGITKDGTGILVISGSNTYDGVTTITTGKIQSNNANALGSTIGNTQVATGAELLFDGIGSNFTTPEAIQIAGTGAGDGGAISVQNSAKITFGGAVALTADAALSTASSATATYSNASAITGTDTSLTLQGAGGNGTISGAVSLGAGSLTKNDSGAWTLLNAAGNTYNGGTTINSGKLLANNTTGSATGSGSVTVNNGGTLGGTGNTDATGGAVSVASGGRVQPGTGAASGTLTAPSLNLQTDALLSAALGASNSAAKVAVTDTDAATINGKLEIVTTNGFTNGTFRILTYNGTRMGAGLQPSTQAGFDNITILDSGTSGFIDINVTVTERTWADDTGSGNWSDNNNWGPSPPQTPPDGPGAIANFNATSPNNPAHTVTLDSARTLGIVNFNSATKYTIAGSTLTIDTWGADGQINTATGSHEISAPLTLAKNTNVSVAGGQNLLLSGIVSGSGGIINSGSGTTTLTGVNTYTGGNTVSAGTLVGDSTSIIGAIADNGAVVFNQTVDGTYAGIISGTGTVTKNGSAVLGLTAANLFTGGFNLNTGTAAVNSTTALGAANSPVNIANGTTLSTTAGTARTLTYAFAANGNFTLGQATGGTAAVTMAGTVNLGGATRTISLVNVADTISGVISNGGLTVNAGTGNVLSITGLNTYSGNTTLSTGTTSINGTSTLGDGTGTINMAGGTLRTSASRTATTAPVANPLNMTVDTLVETTSTATTVDLNFTNNSIVGSAGTLTFKNTGADGATDTFQPRFTGDGFNFSRPIVIDNGATGKTKLMSFNTTGTSHTFSGVISGTGSYNRSASTATTGGTSILTAGNTYAGGTTVNDGLLLVNNTVSTESGTGTGPVTIGAGAATLFRGTLGGTGYISGLVTVQEGGAIAPGNSIGTLNLKGGLTLQTNAVLNMELGAPSTGDLINVTPTDGLTINGGTVNLINAGSLGAGTYTLIDYVGTLMGSFSNLILGTQPTGFTYMLVNNTSNTSIDLSVASAGLPGDFNSDGKVDAGDYVTWRKNNGTNNALANDNGLGTPIGTSHYNLWRANFGNPPGAGSGGGLNSGGAVPEPSAIALLAIGLLAASFRRRG